MMATFRPNPNFGDDAKKALAKKLSEAGSIVCSQHKQTAILGKDGKIVGCCDDLEKRVAEFLESR